MKIGGSRRRGRLLTAAATHARYEEECVAATASSRLCQVHVAARPLE